MESQAEADAIHSDVKIFTDGSKLESGKTGAAMVIYRPGRPPEPRKFKLEDHCTVYQAEMYAIYEAVNYIEKRCKGKTVTIYSDSRSSLDALMDRSHNSPLGVSIHRTLASVKLDSTTVNFAWVKAHIGIDGNEAADEAAKQATEKHSAKVYTSFPISYAKRLIKEEAMKLWRHEYRSAVQGSTTRLFLPSLDDAISLRSATDLTFEMTQVLTGHCFSREYLTRFHIMTDDNCPCDGNTHQSLVHLLMSCPRYDAYRRHYFGLCEEADAEPFNLADIASQEHLLDGFVTFTHRIISTLKAFNSD